MKIVEVTVLNNGAHRNQTFTHNVTTIPNGWAVIPDDLECENFPFGTLTTEEVDGIVTVTSWTAGEIPEVDEEEEAIDEVEQLRADVDYIAIMTGVDLT